MRQFSLMPGSCSGALSCSFPLAISAPGESTAESTTGVRVLQSIDIAVRHAESFASMQDAIA